MLCAVIIGYYCATSMQYGPVCIAKSWAIEFALLSLFMELSGFGYEMGPFGNSVRCVENSF